MQAELPLDGFCCGPLFKPAVKRRPPKPHNGPERVQFVWSRVPGWTTREQVLRLYKFARMTTVATGVQHSLDHIVPLVHPLVCGLHCPDNLHVIPLRDNVRKSNNWWPDMPEQQAQLFTEEP